MTVSRRRFLQTTSAVTATSLLACHSGVSAAEKTEDIRIAVIGCGGRGGSHIGAFKKSIVALCDADEKTLANRVKQLNNDNKVEGYTDYRKLLERKDIDAVSIATPNHQHSIMGILAAMAGKDVYVEKPVSHNVWEGRQLVNASRKYDRIIQCGTQSRSSPSLKEAVKFVQDGNLGKIKYAVGTCYKRRGSIGKLDKPLEIPEHIDFDLWCGPAAMEPIYRPRLHYDWHWDFNTGNGDMGNQGIHQMDIARWFLGEAEISPRVMSIGGRVGYDDAGNTPNTQIVYHDYEKAPLIFETRGLGKDVNYRGSKIGVVIQCEKGYVVVPSYTSAIAYDDKDKEIKKWSGGGNHFGNFLDAVKSRKREDLNAEILDGHISSALCHTGNISHRVGQKASASDIKADCQGDPLMSDSFERMAKHLDANEVDIDGSVVTLGPWIEFDTKAETITNNDEAKPLVTREYRKPYVVPDLTAST